MLACSPPDAFCEAVFRADHTLHGVVQLITHTYLAVCHDLLIERLESLHVACQLVCVAFVKVVLAVVVPRCCLVVVERVTTAEDDILEGLDISGILAEEATDLLHLSHGALLPGGVVRLVEGRYAHHLQALALHVCLRGGDECCPAGREHLCRLRDTGVIPVDNPRLLIGVEVDARVGSPFLYIADAPIQP